MQSVCQKTQKVRLEFICVSEFIANSVNLRAPYSVLRAVSGFMALFSCDSIWIKLSFSNELWFRFSTMFLHL